MDSPDNAEVPVCSHCFQALRDDRMLKQHKVTCVKGWRPIWERAGRELRIVRWPCEFEAEGCKEVLTTSKGRAAHRTRKHGKNASWDVSNDPQRGDQRDPDPRESLGRGQKWVHQWPKAKGDNARWLLAQPQDGAPTDGIPQVDVRLAAGKDGARVRVCSRCYQGIPGKDSANHEKKCKLGWLPVWNRAGDHLYIAHWPCEVAGCSKKSDSMRLRALHRSKFHGKSAVWDLSGDPQETLEPDPRQRFGKPSDKWVFNPRSSDGENTGWVRESGLGSGSASGDTDRNEPPSELLAPSKAYIQRSTRQDPSGTGSPSRTPFPPSAQDPSSVHHRRSGSQTGSPGVRRESSVDHGDNELVCSHCFQGFPHMTAEGLVLHREGCCEGERPVWQEIDHELRIVNWPCRHCEQGFAYMAQRNKHQSRAHGKIPKSDTAADPATAHDYDPRKRFKVLSTGKIWVSRPGQGRGNARWVQQARLDFRVSFSPPPQSPSDETRRGRNRHRDAGFGSPRGGAASLAQSSPPAAVVQSPSLTRLQGLFATSPGSPQSLSSAPSSTGSSPRRAAAATSSSAGHRMATPTGVPLASPSADRAPSARPDHPARSPQSRSPSARGSPIGLGDTSFLFQPTEFGGWARSSRSASGSRPDEGRRSASASTRPSQGGDQTPNSLGPVGNLFGGFQRSPAGPVMQWLEHSPLRGPHGSPPPMARYSSPSSRSSSIMSTGGVERAFEQEQGTSSPQQRSLSPPSTHVTARRAASAPPTPSPLRQPPITAQTASRASIRPQEQPRAQLQPRSASASRLLTAPYYQPSPMRASPAPRPQPAAPVIPANQGRRPAPSSGSSTPPIHQTKRPRRG